MTPLATGKTERPEQKGKNLGFVYPTSFTSQSVSPASRQGSSWHRTNPPTGQNSRLWHAITMSAMDIVSTVTILINLGMEIKSRLDSLNQAAEELQLLTTNLSFLLNVFKDPANKDIIQANASEFIIILNILESIGQSCKECAKALDIELAGASIGTKTESGGKKFFKRIWAFNKIPDLLADIQRKAEQLQRAYSAVSIVFLQHIKVQQGRPSGKETVESSTIVRKPTNHENLLDLDVSTNFANIDRIVGSLMKECENLRRRLQEATLFPDPSVVQDYQAQNPEAASFWKDRFQKEELNASNLRYEVRELKLTSNISVSN